MDRSLDPAAPDVILVGMTLSTFSTVYLLSRYNHRDALDGIITRDDFASYLPQFFAKSSSSASGGSSFTSIWDNQEYQAAVTPQLAFDLYEAMVAILYEPTSRAFYEREHGVARLLGCGGAPFVYDRMDTGFRAHLSICVAAFYKKMKDDATATATATVRD
jgi:hypothetical protein